MDDEDDKLKELPFDEARRIFSRKNQAEQPTQVKPVGRLSNNLKALKKLFGLYKPPRRLVRGKSIKEAVFGFGNASGQGFGASPMGSAGGRLPSLT